MSESTSGQRFLGEIHTAVVACIPKLAKHYKSLETAVVKPTGTVSDETWMALALGLDKVYGEYQRVSAAYDEMVPKSKRQKLAKGK